MTAQDQALEIVCQFAGLTAGEVAGKLGWPSNEAVSALVRLTDQKRVFRVRKKTPQFPNVGIWTYTFNPSPPPRRVLRPRVSHVLTREQWNEFHSRPTK